VRHVDLPSGILGPIDSNLKSLQYAISDRCADDLARGGEMPFLKKAIQELYGSSISTIMTEVLLHYYDEAGLAQHSTSINTSMIHRAEPTDVDKWQLENDAALIQKLKSATKHKLPRPTRPPVETS
jgi:hypothetical protein